MRVAAFVLLLLAALGYAACRGGGPERAMVGISSAMVISDLVLHLFVPPGYASLDFGHFVIDGFGVFSTLVLALTAHRFWPILAAALHILPMMAHFSRAWDLAMHPAAYMILQVSWSWLVPPLLILGTWRHQQRVRRNGSDPSWRSSSRRSPRIEVNN